MERVRLPVLNPPPAREPTGGSAGACGPGGGPASGVGTGPAAGPRPDDRELARKGWERRFVGGPPRLEEIVETYESLGLEVRLEPLDPGELAEECSGCRLALALYRAVYTRRRH